MGLVQPSVYHHIQTSSLLPFLEEHGGQETENPHNVWQIAENWREHQATIDASNDQ